MANPQISPISRLLHTLGITREDLEKRSDQMRQFLTAENANSLRVAGHDNTHNSNSSSDLRPVTKSTGSTASLARSRSRTNSYSFRDSTPPVTPVKSESFEGSVPLRQFDSMEMVIERQRRQSRREKRERRERERESMTRANVPQPPSPSPSNTPSNTSQTGYNLDSFMQRRDDQRVLPTETEDTTGKELMQSETQTTAPVTPQRSKYYRDHTNLSANVQSQRKDESFALKEESPSPTRARAPPFPHGRPSHTQYYAYPQYLAYAGHPFPFGNAQASSSTIPVTPQHQRSYTLQRENAFSPLPPSSPPPPSSPVATPNRRIVNLVSSPGPMGPLPDEEEYDTLPYTLPPGPYSPNKPDLSYAALVGQAILSSPEHRLTLQEIYDWITIVYPHFKRGEQTWMNSIRHVLSTTVCFRKVPRERSVGRTQWAIWDEDLECFKGGGFRKQLCKDIINGNAGKDKQIGSRTKSKGKKRVGADEDLTAEIRKAKKLKKDHPTSSLSGSAISTYLPATMSSHPLFPPIRPTPHHQPYYESCLPQVKPQPGDIIFPPLPAGVGYRIGGNASVPGPAPMIPESDSSLLDEGVESTPSVPPALSDTPSSVPELTPNRSSSSPLPATSDMDISFSSIVPKPIKGNDGIIAPASASILDDDFGASVGEEGCDNSLLGPVKFWGESPKSTDSTLRSGIRLGANTALSDPDENEESLMGRSKVAKKPEKIISKKKMSFPPMPSSPTLKRRAAVSKVLKASTGSRSRDTGRAATPPLPSTPPRNTRQLPTSSIRTPLAEKGSSINPVALSADPDEDIDSMDSEINRTPRKRISDSGMPGAAPVTPRKLVFPANQNDSPFRTPGGIFGTSPFRTPGSRAIFDPHDPGALLDEELSRMGAAGHGDSPGGLFGKGRGSLLYDSPGLHSPGQWHKWW